MNTAERLVAAASDLLDEGGQSAVTLRAVAAACDVSHNAPYKHFDGREGLLAAVAAADYATLTEQWTAIRDAANDPRERLLDALDVLVAFDREHRARYRLLFGVPDVAARGPALDSAAEVALDVFSDIVAECQRTGVLPSSPSHNLGIMLFATVHGLIDADASGRLRARTGWSDLRVGMRFLLELLGPVSADPGQGIYGGPAL